MKQHEVRVQNHGAGALVGEHVRGVLGDAGANQVKLPPFRPELREVIDDGGVAEERLDFIDVEPGGNTPLEVRIHPVAHGL